jgi:hypothetical protein
MSIECLIGDGSQIAMYKQYVANYLLGVIGVYRGHRGHRGQAATFNMVVKDREG